MLISFIFQRSTKNISKNLYRFIVGKKPRYRLPILEPKIDESRRMIFIKQILKVQSFLASMSLIGLAFYIFLFETSSWRLLCYPFTILFLLKKFIKYKMLRNQFQ